VVTVAILFAREDSIYKSMSGCDVYDIKRDGLTFPGQIPVVAHPPCRAWGRLRYFAKPRPGEKELALFAVDKVRECGGVLEHPSGSSLWAEKALPDPGSTDQFGGFTIRVNQHWWGHKATKSTLLYICGVDPARVPPAPLVFSSPTHVVAQCSRSAKRRPELSKADRERTPPEFAKFLVNLAEICSPGRKVAV